MISCIVLLWISVHTIYLFLTNTFFTGIMGLKIIAVAIGIGILLTITAFGNGSNSAYAKHELESLRYQWSPQYSSASFNILKFPFSSESWLPVTQAIYSPF